jgi:hypothetical protein
MSIYECNPEWPICLYDYTYQANNPEQITLRLAYDLHSFIIPNHFFKNCKQTNGPVEEEMFLVK